jgi:lysophospholipase L1-like esterase
MGVVSFKPQPIDVRSDPLSPLVNIVVDGDSLAFGSKASPGKSFPSQMAALLGKRYPITNIAVPGQGTSDMVRNEAKLAYPLVNPKAKKNVIVVWELTNEAVSTGVKAADCVNHILTYVENATSHKYDRAIVLTMVNRKGFTGGETVDSLEVKRLAINDLLRADRGAHFTLVDLAIHPQLENSSNRRFFNEDQVHLTDAGYAIVAKDVAAAILKGQMLDVRG